ncbi:hypothetical protein [Streptomyces sp. SID12501]|uniref:Cyanobacterial TRADD-N associated 2 transmembrane domain-containing protein n=1 Tax=Streptomyces sp. SID12501 TaxID=2706042 RepID=A0A6B3BSG1_9ACTN|nr:hypothetical protein [Streptomyces sp. SID12501]NEC87286.1 hypothetical protein [Streptomyces sp. SID12501]
MGDYLQTTLLAATFLTGLAMQSLTRQRRDRFDYELRLERERLRSLVVPAAAESSEAGDTEKEDQPDESEQDADLDDSEKPRNLVEKSSNKPSMSPQTLTQRVDDDKFAELLIEYYAYGLTQARSSFVTSQRFAGFGASILLIGIAIAVWRAETSGDLYLGVVTSSAGVVTMLIGQLFHRRADIALRHMATQTDGLRDDMRAERSTEQALALLTDVGDPKIKVRLQAGLIMKLASSSMPSLAENSVAPGQRELNGTQAAASADGSVEASPQ